MQLVTIAARNYLSRAKALGESFARPHPDDQFHVLLVDALPGEFESTPACRIITGADLQLDPDEFRRMALIYDVTELSTSLKPWALELLLAEHPAETAVYLDPDILVYDRLDEIDRLAQEHGIVLTPHRESPMPRDGQRPNEAEIMCSGVFNLGFIAVRSAARPMLAWWQERLRRDCISAPEQMLFVDQRWIDLVPAMWDHAILRDPGYNVAYWNLDDREVTRADGLVRVNGKPLRFFHFSGYDPDRPWILSKYVSDRPRVSLDDEPVVHELCDDYAAIISAGDDHGLYAPYRWNRLNDGTPVTPLLRRLYRKHLLDQDAGKGDDVPVPFVGADEALAGWLQEPLTPGGLVNRQLHAVWEQRSDLRDAFPHPLGRDDADLVRWAWQNLDEDPNLSLWLLPDVADKLDVLVTDVDDVGVNLAGYLEAEMGVGELSRLTALGLGEAGLPFATFVNHATLSRQRASYARGEDGVRYPVTVAAVNADQFPLWAAAQGGQLTTGRHTVGLWAWETEDFPRYDEALELVDEVWAISAFVRDAVRRRTSKPVHVVPLPVLQPSPHEELDRDSLGLPDGPYFLFVFDYLSVLERKNPVGLVSAFRSAFAEGTGPTLVIKTMNARRYKSERTRLRRACGTRTDIVIIDDYLEHDAVCSLMGEATAYVSLHRSEGFGLTMAESMARGVPVIATGYSGNLDFMTPDCSLLVPHRRVSIGREAHPYDAKSMWAEPDLDAAAEMMRWVVDSPQRAADLGARGRASILRTHSLQNTAQFLRARVVEAMGVSERAADAVAPAL